MMYVVALDDAVEPVTSVTVAWIVLGPEFISGLA